MDINAYKRPWWLITVQMPLLQTTLEEKHQDDQKQFIIEGKPEIKSLSWVLYGPLLAVGSVLILGALAWLMDIRTATRSVKLLFVCLLGLTPILAWVICALTINKLGRKHLELISEQHTQSVSIILNLTEQSFQLDQHTPILFSNIEDFKLVTNAGVYYNPNYEEKMLHNLVMETVQGRVKILPQNLGSIMLKLQLIDQFKDLIKSET